LTPINRSAFEIQTAPHCLIKVHKGVGEISPCPGKGQPGIEQAALGVERLYVTGITVDLSALFFFPFSSRPFIMNSIHFHPLLYCSRG
jgi:hypothetical protein